MARVEITYSGRDLRTEVVIERHTSNDAIADAVALLLLSLDPEYRAPTFGSIWAKVMGNKAAAFE